MKQFGIKLMTHDLLIFFKMMVCMVYMFADVMIVFLNFNFWCTVFSGLYSILIHRLFEM